MTTKTTPPTTRRLEQLTRRVNRALERALASPSGSPRVLHEAMRYCVLSGGKRYRPLLCLGGCEAVGGDVHAALPVACAIELIHAYSLVHDDLPAMDNAQERRGRPSCHRRFGEATAILVGDALLTRAFEVLSANGIPNVLAILRTVGQASGTAGLIGGQALDLECGVRSAGCGITQLEEVARRKTAALITASIVSGGLAAGASQPVRDRLQRFGQQLGLAFQLMDDLHDGDGLARAIGREAVRAKATRLITGAKQELVPFGAKASVLATLADWLMKS